MENTWISEGLPGRAALLARKGWSALQSTVGRSVECAAGISSSQDAARAASSCLSAMRLRESERLQLVRDAWDAFGPEAFEKAFARPAWQSQAKWCMPFEVALRLDLPEWSERLARLCPKKHVAGARIDKKRAMWAQRGRADMSGPANALGALCEFASAREDIRTRLLAVYMECREAPSRGAELMAALSMLDLNDPARGVLLAWVEAGEIKAATCEAQRPSLRARAL